MFDDGVGDGAGQGGEPGPVIPRRHADRIAGQLAVGEPFGVLPAALDQGVHQRVTIAGSENRGQVTRFEAGRVPTS